MGGETIRKRGVGWRCFRDGRSDGSILTGQRDEEKAHAMHHYGDFFVRQKEGTEGPDQNLVPW